MAISVIPRKDFVIQTADKLRLQIGAYRWTDYNKVDLRTPNRPPPTQNPNQIYVDPY